MKEPLDVPHRGRNPGCRAVSFVAPGSAALDSCCRCFWDEPGHDDRSDDVWLRGTMSTIRKFTVP